MSVNWSFEYGSFDILLAQKTAISPCPHLEPEPKPYLLLGIIND